MTESLGTRPQIDTRPPLPAGPLDHSAVYWIKLFDCPRGWPDLRQIENPKWERLVRCDDPDDSPAIARWYKQEARLSMGSVYFAYTDQSGTPHHA